ncbi:MAG: serine/threonine protein kinase [Acidobacteriia bacterium]|nr:serine/threonine protein kinase [Terriglobia bacterium]
MRIPVHPGDQIDHYQIEGVADRTGSASVFRAIDLRTKNTVAIKIPDPEIEADPIFFERFQREEEIGRSLDHPGILRIFSDEQRSQAYIVSEWFDGVSLRQILNAEKLVHERAVRIALNIANALAYIQDHGVRHRDVRPENILVGAADEIKLTNFGTATKTGARRITFTNIAQVVGVSEYVSPEELNGKRDDGRSDIYSLGVILYEMLTGKTPFQGLGPYDRLLNNPTPPRDLDATISVQLQEVIYRALEREPKDRYANAHEFSSDLANLERVKVVRHPKLQTLQKTRVPAWKRIILFVGIAALPVVIFALLLYFARR